MSYPKFFHLDDVPFRITPDPDYFFPSDVHNEALETLIYSIQAGEGFVEVVGAPGTGKTLLLRTLLQSLNSRYNLALIMSPSCSPRELIWMILEDLGIIKDKEGADFSKERLIRLFHAFLLETSKTGVRTLIVIDEAQNLPEETLEELRLLSNLETHKEKLLQIILLGQTELAKKLASKNLRQLAQRITTRYHLPPFKSGETKSYIKHRLEKAGSDHSVQFGYGVFLAIHHLSKGVPRLINIICERALMAAFSDSNPKIQIRHLRRAMTSIHGCDRGLGQFLPNMKSSVAGIVITVLIVSLSLYSISGTAPSLLDFKISKTQKSVSPLPSNTPHAPPARNLPGIVKTFSLQEIDPKWQERLQINQLFNETEERITGKN